MSDSEEDAADVSRKRKNEGSDDGDEAEAKRAREAGDMDEEEENEELVLDASLDFDEEDEEEVKEEEAKGGGGGGRAAAYDEEVGVRETLTQRLNRRSAPPLPPPPKLRDRLAFSPTATRSPVAGGGGLRLNPRLNMRSRPVVLPPSAPTPTTPSRTAAAVLPAIVVPVDPNRTPEHPDRTPPRDAPSADGGGGDGDDSGGSVGFAPSVTFSPARSLLNASVGGASSVGGGEAPGFSSDEEDDGDTAAPQVPAPAADLDTSMADRLLEEEEEEEAMDWDSVDPGLMAELQRCRESVKGEEEGEAVDGGKGDGALASLELPNANRAAASQKLLLVVDTNIFISQLGQLRRLCCSSSAPVATGSVLDSVVLYVPWAVLRELDALKGRNNNRRASPPPPPGGDRSDLARRARAAINFIHDLLVSKSQKIVGQTGSEEREAETLYSARDSNDDRILLTCLRLRGMGLPAALYTNDRNLANKAMVSGVDAFSSAGLRRGLEAALAKLPEFAAPEGDPSAGERGEGPPGDGGGSSSSKKVSPGEMFSSFNRILGQAKDNDLNGNVEQTSVDLQNVESLFTTTWHYIHTYTWLYARLLGVELQGQLSQSPPQPFSQLTVAPEDARACLRPITAAVIRLYDRLYRCLRLDRARLSAASAEVTEFLSDLRDFLPSLPVPPAHPEVPRSPAAQLATPRALVEYLLRDGSRRKVDFGFGQLQGLKLGLNRCCLRLCQDDLARAGGATEEEADRLARLCGRLA